MRILNVTEMDEFELRVAGKIAFENIQTPCTGRVAALFKRSIYVAMGNNWICLGTNSLPLGPLNIQTNLPQTMDWQASGVKVNDKVRISINKMLISDLLTFSSHNLKVWVPERRPPLHPSTLTAGLETLVTVAQEFFPINGLVHFVIKSNEKPTALNIAEPAITDLLDIFTLKNLNRPVDRLIGLGPGLTPSGDDFLIGMLITLDLLGEKKLLNLLVQEINKVASKTNEISQIHLKAAARGIGAAALHATINNITTNNKGELHDSLKKLDAIGHCSGWDALTGAIVAFRAWLNNIPK